MLPLIAAIQAPPSLSDCFYSLNSALQLSQTAARVAWLHQRREQQTMSGKKKAAGSELAAINKKKLRSTDVSLVCGGSGLRSVAPNEESANSCTIALPLRAGDPCQGQAARGPRAGGAGSAEVRNLRGAGGTAAAATALAAGLCLRA